MSRLVPATSPIDVSLDSFRIRVPGPRRIAEVQRPCRPVHNRSWPSGSDSGRGRGWRLGHWPRRPPPAAVPSRIQADSEFKSAHGLFNCTRGPAGAKLRTHEPPRNRQGCVAVRSCEFGTSRSRLPSCGFGRTEPVVPSWQVPFGSRPAAPSGSPTVGPGRRGTLRASV
jgi:hypothetical protein